VRLAPLLPSGGDGLGPALRAAGVLPVARPAADLDAAAPGRRLVVQRAGAPVRTRPVTGPRPTPV
jgi:hypothetical protein